MAKNQQKKARQVIEMSDMSIAQFAHINAILKTGIDIGNSSRANK